MSVLVSGRVTCAWEQVRGIVEQARRIMEPHSRTHSFTRPSIHIFTEHPSWNHQSSTWCLVHRGNEKKSGSLALVKNTANYTGCGNSSRTLYSFFCCLWRCMQCDREVAENFIFALTPGKNSCDPASALSLHSTKTFVECPRPISVALWESWASWGKCLASQSVALAPSLCSRAWFWFWSTSFFSINIWLYPWLQVILLWADAHLQSHKRLG